MRRIISFNRVSADGYFTTPDGKLDWVVPDDELDRAGVDQMPGGDTILFGRRTYDNFESFWPHVLEASPTAPDPHAPGRQSPALRAMATWINEATKLVFSRTRTQVSWKNSRLFHELEPREIEAIKRQPGKDILIFGSGTITSLLTSHGLIDEYQFVVGPVLLGNGRSLLHGVPHTTRLDLVEHKQYDSGNVLLRYARRS